MYRHLLHASTFIVLSLTSLNASYADTQSKLTPDQAFNYERDQDTNKLRMLRGRSGPMSLKDTSQRPLHEKVANQFAPQFGINNPGQQLQVKKLKTDNGRTHIRYGQMHQGLPVIGAELVANLNAQNQLLSMSGETSSTLLSDITPTISAEQASDTAVQAVAKWYQLQADQLIPTTPVLSVYDPSLLVRARSSSSLVWQVNVAPSIVAPINEYLLIDAKTGGVVFHFNEVDTALSRSVYTASNTPTLPGALVCDESTPGNCAADTDAQAAFDFAGDTYDFYFTTHARDGIDGSGSTIVSTVDWNDGINCPNAFWDGTQMVYCDTFAQADDVVAHELTHGVTENTSNLIYYSESGAINESLSDAWGEFVDQTNGAGINDGPSYNWEMGEDLPISSVRDMANPGLFNDPDRMTSNNFYTGREDNGGVHINSGVNNKAVYLMVEGSSSEPGGQFNGQTVTGMGITKTATLYYQVQTSYLTTGSDYLDLYNALITECAVLATAGTAGFVSADCTGTVQPALTAVEMNQAPAAYTTPAQICTVGTEYDLLYDNFESNNLNNWTIVNTEGNSVWAVGTDNVSATTTGAYSALGRGNNTGNVNDSSLQLTNAIRSPTSATAYIHFDQAFYFEYMDIVGQGYNFDGGVIEYSIDNGSTWNDASGLIEAGLTYNGQLADNNPQGGRSAYTAYSHGFNSTRLNLSTLAGQWVKLRFRSLADQFLASGPWTIDNFRVYLCANNAPPIPNAGADQSVRGDELVTLTGSVSDPDGDPVTYTWTQTSGTTVTLNNANTLTPSFTSPRSTGNLVFELSATSNGVTETDSTQVTVNFFLSGNVTGGGSGCTVSESGRFDPVWLLMLLLFAGMHLRNRKKIKH